MLLAQLPFSLHAYETSHLNLQLALRLAVQPGVEVPDEDHGVAGVAVYQYMGVKRDLRQRPRHGPGDSGGTVPEVGAVYLRASAAFSEKLRSWLCWGCSKAGRKLRSCGRSWNLFTGVGTGCDGLRRNFGPLQI